MRRGDVSTSTGHLSIVSAHRAASISVLSAKRRRFNGIRSSSYGRRASNRCCWASCRDASCARSATWDVRASSRNSWPSVISPISIAQHWTNCSRYIASISSYSIMITLSTTIWCIRGVAWISSRVRHRQRQVVALRHPRRWQPWRQPLAGRTDRRLPRQVARHNLNHVPFTLDNDNDYDNDNK